MFMNTATATTDLTAEVTELIMDAGFCPLEAADVLTAEWDIDARQAGVLGYFAERGWDAFRLEPKGEVWATLVSWSDEGVELLAIDRNGVSEGDLRFPLSTRGLGWFASVVG
jgi:hypothetical protein